MKKVLRFPSEKVNRDSTCSVTPCKVLQFLREPNRARSSDESYEDLLGSSIWFQNLVMDMEADDYLF